MDLLIDYALAGQRPRVGEHRHPGERLGRRRVDQPTDELSSAGYPPHRLLGAKSRRADVSSGSSLEEMERRLIEATLEQFDGHREKTAKALGIGVRTLSGKLRQ